MKWYGEGSQMSFNNLETYASMNKTFVLLMNVIP